MKINWGTGIVIALVAFMLFILSFVYKTFTNKKYDHHLVTEEYYKDELNYQKEIDAEKNASNLSSKIIIKHLDDGIEVVFPEDLKDKKINGTIHFLRSSNEKLDFEIPIKLTNNKQKIADAKLVKGIYIVTIKWQSDNKKYQYKDNFYY
ncbi:MAG TPA: cytochrome C oxidase Cbb3 [Flavobacteriia bacterium]|nr:cytochrome C oxidase Cbb3 [Flavobacteriia bacterium]